MQALSDDQRIDVLEKKMDEGFAEIRAELKAVRSEIREDLLDMRTEIKALYRLVFQIFSGMSVTMILGFAGILLQHQL